MKKLMTVLASAATALFAFGETLTSPQGANFEAYSEGAVFDAQKDDLGTTSGNKFWYSTAAAGEIGDISNHVGQVNVSVPDFFALEQTNENYLHIDASAPLFRSAVAHSNTFEPGEDYTFTGVDIGDGIYLDTLVQFTAADDAFQTDLESGDKIAISYVEHEDDLTTGENEAWTNFVIRAGAIVDEEFGQANYFATVPAGFNKDDWHRLTVRTIKDVGDGQVGFVIYLDGDMTKTLKFTNNVETGFNEERLSPLAKSFYEVNALYPSAVASAATGGTTISAASFSGTGALDDVVFTTTRPGFIQEAATVTVKWDVGFASVKINGTAVTDIEAGSSGEVVTLTGNTVDIEYTLAAGYEAGTFVGNWVSEDIEAPIEGTFTGVNAGATLELKSLKANFDVNGTHYEKVSEAIAAAVEAGTSSEAPATIKLLADYAGDIELSDAGYIVIDLAGKDINGAEYGINNSAATLTIINSTETIGHVTGVVGAVMIAGGSTTINNGIFDAAVVIDTETFELKLLGGQFLNCPDEIGDTNFYLNSFVDGSVTATAIANNYFQVGEGGEQPTTYDVTYTKPEHAEVVTDPATITGLAAGATVAFTVTPGEGYEYAEAPTGWTLDNGAIKMTYTVVAGTNEVTIPAPTAVIIGTYEVTVTPADNATYAAAYKDGGAEITPANDVLTVTVGKTIVITATAAEGYEYAEAPTGWTLSEGVITIEVSEAGTVAIPEPTAQQQGSYPSYIKGETAQGKYDTWKSYVEGASETVGDGEALEDAYLLNCKPSEVEAAKAAFKFTSISYDAEQSKWVTTTTTGYNGRGYNGTVTVKQYSDVGCKTESATGTFFKAVLQ
jgi:hypothetical protein